jgi:cupin-like protein
MNNVITPGPKPAEEKKQYGDDIFSVIPGFEKASAVPVLDAAVLTEEVFKRDWVSKNKPCLIKGIVKHWPAVGKWKNKEYWTDTCENVDVNVYPHINHNDPSRLNAEKMKFYDALERVYSSSDQIFSMPGETITEDGRFSGVIKDMPGFACLPSSEMPRVYDRRRFFMYRRAATAWHYHGIDETLMCQVKGAKKVALLPPDIPRAKYVTRFLHDELHLEGRTLDKSLELRPCITEVMEGDALYIPPYWHHAVIPCDGEIGFTLAFCWRSAWYKLGDFSNYFVRDVYRQGIWPFTKFTPFLPFLGMYAGISYCVKKITGVV